MSLAERSETGLSGAVPMRRDQNANSLDRAADYYALANLPKRYLRCQESAS